MISWNLLHFAEWRNQWGINYLYQKSSKLQNHKFEIQQTAIFFELPQYGKEWKNITNLWKFVSLEIADWGSGAHRVWDSAQYKQNLRRCVSNCIQKLLMTHAVSAQPIHFQHNVPDLKQILHQRAFQTWFSNSWFFRIFPKFWKEVKCSHFF